MGFLGKHSLGTHLLVAAGLLVGVCAFAVVRNWDTFRLMYANMTAMNEGRQAAEQMRRPEDLLDYLAAHPEQASLVAYEVGARAKGIFFQPAVRRPIVKTDHLLLLTEYARQIRTGRLAPQHPVPLDSLSVFALPGAGRDNHKGAVAHWNAENDIRSDSTVALREVVRAIGEHGDTAAADWLMMKLGRAQLQALPQRWGLSNSSAPVPTSGVHISWSTPPPKGTTASQPVRYYRSMSRESYTDRVYRLTRALRRETSFRRQERRQLRRRGSGLSVRTQRALAEITYPKGTSADYAGLLARSLDGTLGSRRVETFLHRQIETSLPSESAETSIRALGTHGGAVPGIISLVGYTRFEGEKAPRVCAFFLEGLPIGLFYHLVQTSLDKGFLLRVLSDPNFYQRVRTRLGEQKGPPLAPSE
ncbi:MAG: serine hydrolase [Salinibacter sp.]